MLYKCTNTTENNNHCMPENEIYNTIQGGIINLLIKNSILQMTDYENPVKYGNDGQFFSLNLDFTFGLTIELKTLLFQTDKGYLLTDIEEIKGFYFQDPKLLYFGKRGNLLADITIQTVQRGVVINRQYVKFQDVLTKIGGLIKALMLIGNMIAILASHIEFHNDYIFNIDYNSSITNKSCFPNKIFDIRMNASNSKSPIPLKNPLEKDKMQSTSIVLPNDFNNNKIN